jgi:hypothetical protein
MKTMDLQALRHLLGPFPDPCPLDAAVLETADCGPYLRQTIAYSVEANERVRSFVLLPKHINRPAPAIFAHHQHNREFHLGKSEVVGLAGDPDQAYAAELAQRGYVVIVPDVLALEERNWSNPSGEAEYYELATRLVQGRTLLVKCLHDVSVGLDYLLTRLEVDPLRIGFIGHSYGGRMAIWAPAIDQRIRASVSNCGCVNHKQSFTHDAGVLKQHRFCIQGRLKVTQDGQSWVPRAHPKPLALANKKPHRIAGEDQAQSQPLFCHSD